MQELSDVSRGTRARDCLDACDGHIDTGDSCIRFLDYLSSSIAFILSLIKTTFNLMAM